MLPLSGYLFGTALTLSDVKGWLKWIPGPVVSLLYVVSVVPVAYWIFTHERVRRFLTWLKSQWKANRWKAASAVTAVAILSLITLSSAGYFVWKYATQSRDAKYVPSKNKFVRMDGNVYEFAMPDKCKGLPDDKEIECLCPRPLDDYTLTALPTPSDNNYATLLNVKSGRESMYRIAIYGRTPMYSGSIEVSPNDIKKGNGSLVVSEMAFDRYALGITSTAPQNEFKLEIKTSEGLRLRCINQLN